MAMAEAFGTRQRLSETNLNVVTNYREKLLSQIYEHFDDQDLMDVTFKLANSTTLVPAHRLILSSASPYFKQLFRSDEGICPVIEIDDIESDTFERLITFCYTGTTLVTIDNVDQMFKAALKLQLDDAVCNCADFIIEHVTSYSLQRAFNLESETQSATLNQKILEYIIANFMTIAEDVQFLNLDSNRLQKILESDDLNVRCEKDAFEAVTRWYEHDTSARKEQLPDIISCLRLTQFDTNFIVNNIQPLPGCQLLAFEALSWVNIPSIRPTIPLKFPNPRESEYLAEPSFWALNIEGGESRTIFQYDKTQDIWQKWVDIKIDVTRFQTIYMDENLIFIGGIRTNEPVNDVSSWNFRSKTFKKLPALNQPRSFHSVVLLNNKIYAVGGRGPNKETLGSVEMYRYSGPFGWKLRNRMITPRCRASTVIYNQKIYVLGGHNGGVLKSVECYDPTTDCWTQCTDMNEVHDWPGAAVHKENIFVVGGNNNNNYTSVERYDPKKNEWTMICHLNNGRSALGCISIDNQLWTVGGKKKSGDYKNCVSVYDEQNDKWIDKESITFADMESQNIFEVYDEVIIERADLPTEEVIAQQDIMPLTSITPISRIENFRSTPLKKRKLSEPSTDVTALIQEVIQAQNRIENKIDELKNNMVDKTAFLATSKTLREVKVYVKLLKNSVATITGENPDELLTEIAALLPLNSIAALHDLEEKLQKEEYEKPMTAILYKLKGVDESVVATMKKIFTDELMDHFNYDGRNQKRALDQLLLVDKFMSDVFKMHGRSRFEKLVRKAVMLSHNRTKQKRYLNKSKSSTSKSTKRQMEK